MTTSLRTGSVSTYLLSSPLTTDRYVLVVSVLDLLLRIYAFSAARIYTAFIELTYLSCFGHPGLELSCIAKNDAFNKIRHSMVTLRSIY